LRLLDLRENLRLPIREIRRRCVLWKGRPGERQRDEPSRDAAAG
jgi:hypothetical protein